MRLIDADELRNELTSICSNKVNDYNKTVKAFIEFIDNAPTVTTSFKLENITEDDVDKFKMIFQRATSKGLVLISEDRPQGEWIPDYESQFLNPGRKCSLCGKVVEFSENYCPRCGADMRGTEK